MKSIARVAALPIMLSVVACTVAPEEKKSAIEAVNEAFREDYEMVLKEDGTRYFPVPVNRSLTTTRACLTLMGMSSLGEDIDTGYLRMKARAPKPLTLQEWREAVNVDQPRLRSIVVEHVGFPGHFVRFEPEGLDVVINATALAAADGSRVSLTMRLEETEPPQTGYPRREYPPPSAVRLGLNNIWRCVESRL